ncbi:MAG: 30S ribosome-binding factor RbfA [Deltaproteobacteria bacterium]|nr:MAG: 30S ribosome-binding factor RbfA [Deltaproteobacteria bacterium]
MTEFSRATRVADALHKALAEALVVNAADERLRLVSITAVRLTPDLRIAHVHWLVLGESSLDIRRRRDFERAIRNASGFLRRQLASAVHLKHVPELQFHYDDELEQGRHVAELIDSLVVDTTAGEEDT